MLLGYTVLTNSYKMGFLNPFFKNYREKNLALSGIFHILLPCNKKTFIFKITGKNIALKGSFPFKFTV